MPKSINVSELVLLKGTIDILCPYLLHASSCTCVAKRNILCFVMSAQIENI